MAAALARCGNPSSVHRWGRAARPDGRRRPRRGRGAGRCGAGRRRLRQRRHRGEPSGPRSAPGASACWSRRSSMIRCCARSPGAERSRSTRDGVVGLDALDDLARRRSAAGAGLGHARQQRDRRDPAGGRDRARIAHAARRALSLRRGAGRGQDPARMAALGADLMTLVGAQDRRPAGRRRAGRRPRELDLQPLLRGGGQERGRRAGTENLPGIAGFAAAAAPPRPSSRL